VHEFIAGGVVSWDIVKLRVLRKGPKFTVYDPTEKEEGSGDQEQDPYTQCHALHGGREVENHHIALKWNHHRRDSARWEPTAYAGGAVAFAFPEGAVAFFDIVITVLLC
jgi:hypothetical protein